MRKELNRKFVVANTREHTTSVMREYKFLGGNRGTCVSRNLDETVRLRSEKRRNLLTVFFVSSDVLAISRLFSVVYIRRRNFIYSESVVQRKIAERSKKALFCGDCCDKN